MSEYLRHTADHISWLMRQKRREVAETAYLAARLSRVLQRRGQRGGLAAILGPDEVRRAAGIVALTSAEAPAPQEAHPEPEPVSVPEALEAPPPEPATEQEPQHPEPVEAEPAPVPEPELPPEPADEAELPPDAGPEEAEALAEEPEAPAEQPEAEQAEMPYEGAVEEMEQDIKEAAAEAAAVEGISTGPAEATTSTGAPPGQYAAEAPAAEASAVLDKEAAGLAEIVAEIQDAAEPPAAGAPGLGPAADEVPFEAALEPQALIPGQAVFARAADRVLFDRAIKTLGTGEVSALRDGIEMLGHVPNDAAGQVLMNLYRIAPQRWRPAVVHQLTLHPGSGIEAFFCRMLERGDEPAIVRAAALRGLYARDKVLAADHLLKALGDPSDEVRESAAMYLGWLRDKRAIPLLEQLAATSSEQVAKAAFHAAASIQR